MKAAKKIVIGLGNPGDEFANTYHNVGAAALQALAARLAEQGGNEVAWKTHKKLFSYAVTDRFILIAPLTFMNASGAAAKEALAKFGAAPDALIILHDESDLPMGKYKIAKGRGAAGHKGVQSVMDMLQEKDLTRIRIGIREKDEAVRKKASLFVLKKIAPKDKKVLAETFQKITDDILALGSVGKGH